MTDDPISELAVHFCPMFYSPQTFNMDWDCGNVNKCDTSICADQSGKDYATNLEDKFEAINTMPSSNYNQANDHQRFRFEPPRRNECPDDQLQKECLKTHEVIRIMKQQLQQAQKAAKDALQCEQQNIERFRNEVAEQRNSLQREIPMLKRKIQDVVCQHQARAQQIKQINHVLVERRHQQWNEKRKQMQQHNARLKEHCGRFRMEVSTLLANMRQGMRQLDIEAFEDDHRRENECKRF